MTRPLKMYMLRLCGTLGKLPNEIKSMPMSDILDLMAYDITQGNGWSEKYYENKEKERKARLTYEQQGEEEAMRIKALFMTLGKNVFTKKEKK